MKGLNPENQSLKHVTNINQSYLTQQDVDLSFSRDQKLKLKSYLPNKIQKPWQVVKNMSQTLPSDDFTIESVLLQYEDADNMQLQESSKLKFQDCSNQHQHEESVEYEPTNQEIQHFMARTSKSEVLSQEDMRKRLRQIDTAIRGMQMQRNRLKYFLRKDRQALENSEIVQNLQTKECPCCGKLISKLCFRCQHIYCKVQNCPRKKKQVLNARMLTKMREKKGGSKRLRSRDKRKSQGIKINDSDSEKEDYELSEIEDQESWQEESSTEQKILLKKESQETRKKLKKQDLLQVNLSDMSIFKSDLYLGSDHQ